MKLCIHLSKYHLTKHKLKVLVYAPILPPLRWHLCSDGSFQRSHQCDLPASLGWRLCRRQTSVTSSTPRRRVTGTSSASLTCFWVASPKPSPCSWKPKAPPSLARLAWLLVKGSPPSRCPWSSTRGESSQNKFTWFVTLFSKSLTLFLPVVFSYIRRGESHWWMKGSTPPQIAEIIIKLVKDMAAVSPWWCYWSIILLIYILYFVKSVKTKNVFSNRVVCYFLGPPFRCLVQSHQKCNSWDHYSTD